MGERRQPKELVSGEALNPKQRRGPVRLQVLLMMMRLLA